MAVRASDECLGQTYCMDLTPHIPALIEGRAQVPELMQGSTSLACMGSRALLSLFVCAAPFPASLVGAITTEAEALALVERHRPTYLFATEQLEHGDGLSLVQHGHRPLPELRSLLILQSETLDTAQRAIELGCNGAAWLRGRWCRPSAPWWAAASISIA